jgi:trehalose/maltose hydrolase-like predicted phosphorylase
MVPDTVEAALVPTADAAWTLTVDGFDPLREGSVESRLAVSNGFLGVRGVRAMTRGERRVPPARTYVAGLFDTAGFPGAVRGIVAVSDWLKVRILLPDGALVRHPGELSSHRMTLDMRRGALLSEGRYCGEDGLTMHVRTARLVSLSQRAVGLQLIELEIGGTELDIRLEASFEGTSLGLVVDELDEDLGAWHTGDAGKSLAMATSASLHVDGSVLHPSVLGPLSATWSWRTRPGQVVSFERMVAVVRSDHAGPGPGDAARTILDVARRSGSAGIIAAHEAAWATRWECSDVQVEDDAAAQRALRFATYHLNSAANPADQHVSIGARALTGDDYHGHVFWDTEIFLLPFYVLTWPEAARALLMYRFHTLDGARAKATGMGWRGALYAWESADTGAEMTPEHVVGPDRQVVAVLCGQQEQHISADVAYAVWQYWQATGDEGFLRDAGAEILLEVGRFWCSRAGLEADGLRHIRGVIGPDEYHEHIDDNAFTNVMARWSIRRALEVSALSRARWPERWAALAARIGIDDAELATWRDAAATMATGWHAGTGLFEQFAGYFQLEAIDLAAYAGRSVPMDVVLGRERMQASQVVKQADVVALLGLLPEEFPGASAAANFQYYAPRCSHGSSLSRVMHGVAAARLGESEAALDYFRQTAAIDLGDTHVAIDGGVHIAALGGIWMIAVFGFAGVVLRPDGIAIDPHLPASWRSLQFCVQWRARRLRVRIFQAAADAQPVEATLEVGEPMTVFVRGQPHALRRDGRRLRGQDD